MANQIQTRRDTAANWAAVNPVLAQGEKGIETDGLGTPNVKQKIGDGVTAWDSLPYQESGGGVETVSGEGVDNTDPKNPILSFPSPSDISLGNVDNTSDLDKPVSNDTQTALDDKASDADLTALDGRVSTNEGDISSLQTDVSNKADQSDLDSLDSRVATNEGDIQTLQNNQVNPNNFVNKVTSATQDMTGRLTVQTPVDANTSDAASVGYVLGKTNDKVSSNTTGEPTGATVIGNEVSISQANFTAAETAGTLVPTTIYNIIEA